MTALDLTPLFILGLGLRGPLRALGCWTRSPQCPSLFGFLYPVLKFACSFPLMALGPPAGPCLPARTLRAPCGSHHICRARAFPETLVPVPQEVPVSQEGEGALPACPASGGRAPFTQCPHGCERPGAGPWMTRQGHHHFIGPAKHWAVFMQEFIYLRGRW